MFSFFPFFFICLAILHSCSFSQESMDVGGCAARFCFFFAIWAFFCDCQFLKFCLFCHFFRIFSIFYLWKNLTHIYLYFTHTIPSNPVAFLHISEQFFHLWFFCFCYCAFFPRLGVRIGPLMDLQQLLHVSFLPWAKIEGWNEIFLEISANIFSAVQDFCQLWRNVFQGSL